MSVRSKLVAGAVVVGLLSALGPALGTVATPAALVAPAPAAAPVAEPGTAAALAKVTVKKYKNCKALNKKYKHGVGKKNAKDKVSGRSKKVTNFKRHNALYLRNKHLDRDRDGIACEKR